MQRSILASIPVIALISTIAFLSVPQSLADNKNGSVDLDLYVGITKFSTFYYDDQEHTLLGNEFDTTPPASAIAIEAPVVQIICTPFFESNPANFKAHAPDEFDYSQILDGCETGGVYVGVIPYHLDDPSSIFAYYTECGFPFNDTHQNDD